jgi:hypothetical protein
MDWFALESLYSYLEAQNLNLLMLAKMNIKQQKIGSIIKFKVIKK